MLPALLLSRLAMVPMLYAALHGVISTDFDDYFRLVCKINKNPHCVLSLHLA